MTLASWNVNSLNVRLQQVQRWLEEVPVDVLGMQELKLVDERFPHEAFRSLNYYCASHGQATYNGVAIAAKMPLEEVVRNIPGFDDPQARVIAATIPTALGPVRVVNAYFVNGQAPGSDKFAYKLQWLAQLQSYVAAQLRQYPQLVLMGDFNITASDADSWDPEGLRGTIHHTPEERAAFQALLELGLTDAFRAFEQPPKTFSWWDYRMLGFQKNRGLRIDYVLISEALRPHLRRAWIDRAPRKWQKPSDHAPVLVELALPADPAD
ncbi:exodeoxyribonuclease III [Lampropedia cohaerens]|uniref:Exodeoxyribonuclease III n=1 Tax=Lampropedia cohaerens TaxID=1610491 RepID=A0A0U1Q2E3_9BURK|nr:exodeoxyribonuclease III [Lampropedia cohaerens]KKW68912.1 exodeoxyribonuclease III [Lampropedia cohaerens]